MCGIAGQVGGDPTRAGIHAMCETIVHRGPDSEGCWVGEGVGLGMRRLSIIDLAGGQQPIFSEDREVVTVCNGEIYNFNALRRDLEARGHQFSCSSDVETLVHLYEDHGVDCLRHLRGMYGLALWDCRERRLLLAVDRLGKKPLYYHQGADGRLLFASELKALRGQPGVPSVVDPAMLDMYLGLGYIPAPFTVYRGIHKLPPGHRLVWQGGAVTVEPYWTFPIPTGQGGPRSEAEALEQLEAILAEATKLRMIADVPLGAFLSGGVDSSAIVAFMCEQGQQPPKTFAIGFEDQSFSELEHARSVARHLGTEHEEEIVNPNVAAELPDLVAHFDEPFSDASAIPTHLLCRMTRRHVTVALSGDGGDEIFGGYLSYPAMRSIGRLKRVPHWLRSPAMGLTRMVPETTSYTSLGRRFRRLREMAATPSRAAAYGTLHYQWTTAQRRALLLNGEGGTSPEALLDARFGAVDGLDDVPATMWVDAGLYMPGDILVKVDRMSMYHSLEVRCPLLDQELVAFAATLPLNLKLRGLTTKYLLKKLVAHRLPPEIVKRQKHGFGVPVGRWLREDLRELFQDSVLAADSRACLHVSREIVARVWAEHLAGTLDNTNPLWNVLVLELWLRGLGR